MKQIYATLFALTMLAGCATKPIQLPPTIPLPPGHPQPPPLPVIEPTVHRRTIRAFAASSATATATVSQSDTNSPNYGTVDVFTAEYVGEAARAGVVLKWDNWPDEVPYAIQRSTNLVDWTEAAFSVGDSGRELLVYDLDQPEFYRIIRVFTSQPNP